MMTTTTSQKCTSKKGEKKYSELTIAQKKKFGKVIVEMYTTVFCALDFVQQKIKKYNITYMLHSASVEEIFKIRFTNKPNPFHIPYTVS